jgi:hypothetical protein
MNVCGTAPLLLRAFVGCDEKMMLASVWRVFLRRPCLTALLEWLSNSGII